MDEIKEKREEGGEMERLPLAERVLVSLAVLGLYLMALIITVNAVSRWLGYTLIPDDILLIEELMVPVLLFPIGVVTALREHITVEVFTQKLSEHSKLSLALLGHVVGIVFGAIISYAAIRGFVRSWATQDYYQGVLHIPMWIGHLIFAGAMVL